MMEDIRVIYVDETTFNLWMQPSKLWLKPNMAIPIQNNRGKSLTLIGAIEEQYGLMLYHIIQDTTNTSTFIPFIEALLKKLKNDKAIVVMDNLRVRKTKKVREVFSKLKK